MATYVGVRIQGGLLPAEVLFRLAAGDADLGGLRSGDYHLASHESVREAANRSWAWRRSWIWRSAVTSRTSNTQSLTGSTGFVGWHINT